MIISVLSFAAVFTVLVLVHEFGHFIASRKSGVKVYEFSLGFPFSPRLITLFHHRETAFTIRLLPLGGFVSFSPEGGQEDADLFMASYAKRAVILSAGALCNILFAFAIFVPVFMMGKGLGPIDAMLQSARTVWEILSGTITFLASAISGNGTMEGVSGPVGIAVMAGKAAGNGALSLCYFAGALSMSLGIMNLLPLPALDGGHLLGLLIESVRRKPLNPRVYQTASLVGFALFLLLTLAITYRDVTRLIA